MRKILQILSIGLATALVCLTTSSWCLTAISTDVTATPAVQEETAADRIIGVYLAVYEGDESKVKIFKTEDGTYKAQVVWVKDKFDKDGNVRTDLKNPDKSMRNVPCDEIVLAENISYDSKKDSWGNTKIYDPARGIRANLVCSFDTPTTLKVRGSLMGIGMSVYWEKLE